MITARHVLVGYLTGAGILLGAAMLPLIASGQETDRPATPARSSLLKDSAGGEVLYHDPNAGTSASVTQVMPNSATSIQTYTAVEKIELRQDVFVIHWARGAVTMLPRQFVASITLNRRSARPAETSPATAPAGG